MSDIGRQRISNHALSGCMSDPISLLKARYCRSIMKTASILDDSQARRLIAALTTEVPTPETSPQVGIAERDALASIICLSDRLQNRTVASAASEWQTASDAILRWISAAG